MDVFLGWPLLILASATGFAAGILALHYRRRAPQLQLRMERDEQQDSNLRLKRLHNNLPGILFQSRTSPQHGDSILYISDGIRNYGLTPEVVYADESAFSSLFHPDDALRVRIALSKSRQYLTAFHEEFRIIHGEQTSWIESRAIPTREADGSTLWEGMMVDITSRKQAEAALRSSEEKLKLMAMALANSANGVLLAEVVNDKLPIVYLNPAFSDITGYQPSETMDRHMLFLYEDEEYVNTLQPMRDALAQGTSFSLLLRTRRKNGELFWNSFTLSPIYNRFGDVSHYVAVLNDVTELETARRTAEKAIAVKRDFLANMSHEIRTPLYGILGTVEVMSNSGLPTEQQQWVNILKQTGNSLFTLISDILDFSRIESGTLRLTPAPFSPHTLAEEVIQLQQQAAQDKSLSLTLKIAKNVPAQIIGDRDRIQQIISNYLVNAIKFTDKGKITLKIGVAVGNKNQDIPRIRFAVQDHGIGIASENQTAIFDKFTQADTSANRRFGGTGLGLAICKQLAGLMEGEVGVESALGKGSTFWFEAPFRIAIQQQPSLPVHTMEEPPLPSFSGQRILLAEDNPINRTVTAAMLRKLKLEVILAEDGRQAIDAYQKQDFQLVLMDIQMPILNGFEAAMQIRACETASQRPRTPILAFTANVLDDLPQECIDSGMDDYLPKPIRLEQLVEKLIEHLPVDQSNVIRLPISAKRNGTGKAASLDHAHLDQLRGLLGKQFNELCTRFVIDTSARLSALKQHAKPEDATYRAELAHSLKAAALNVGAQRLYEHFAAIEAGSEDLGPLLRRAEREFKTVQNALAIYQQKVG